jgi:hypothetical protein
MDRTVYFTDRHTSPHGEFRVVSNMLNSCLDFHCNMLAHYDSVVPWICEMTFETGWFSRILHLHLLSPIY